DDAVHPVLDKRERLGAFAPDFTARSNERTGEALGEPQRIATITVFGDHASTDVGTRQARLELAHLVLAQLVDPNAVVRPQPVAGRISRKARLAAIDHEKAAAMDEVGGPDAFGERAIHFDRGGERRSQRARLFPHEDGAGGANKSIEPRHKAR